MFRTNGKSSKVKFLAFSVKDTSIIFRYQNIRGLIEKVVNRTPPSFYIDIFLWGIIFERGVGDRKHGKICKKLAKWYKLLSSDRQT